MTNADVSPIELGRHLTQVRERAGIKQAELARKITWSPTVLSRVESGERTLAQEELQVILSAIGTKEAISLSAALLRDWSMLPRPSLDHPDQDLLWSAEEVAQDLAALRDKPDLRHAFERRVTEYIDELKAAAQQLLKQDHQVAFIGSIGIGKSTAICRLVGLEVPLPDSTQFTPVLEAGAGGITVCEVHLRRGPGYGVLIEPRTDEEIRAYVTDFAEYLLGKEVNTRDDGLNTDAETNGISKEIERAIRNLSGLKIRRDKGPDGKVTRRDEAKELATQLPSIRDFVVEVLSRMELHRRDRRDTWYESVTGKQPLPWLKDTFEKINNGRHPEFTLPGRIEVVVPTPLLDADNLSIRFIDTKGIDRTAARADLEGHLDDPHTLTVLCSGFNDAPSSNAQLLLERARDANVRSITDRAALLVLPRPSEALAVRDESGTPVDSIEEGYELKGEQVAMSLSQLGLGTLSVGFFNSYQDDPVRLKEFLLGRLSHARSTFRERLAVVVLSARTLLENHEKEQVQAVLRDAASMLTAWCTTPTAKPKLLSARVQDSLLTEMASAYASTIRASVRRAGAWHNLDYVHNLGYGARRMAVLSLAQPVEHFTNLLRTLSANPEYAEAKDLMDQAERVLQASYDDVLRKVQLMGETAFRDELKLAASLWDQCDSEWGRGPGYKSRVAGHNNLWFSDQKRRQLESELVAMIEREWSGTIGRISSLLDPES